METKPKNNKLGLTIFLIIDAVLVLACLIQIVWPHFNFGNLAVLNPQGLIAHKERSLLITAVLLMLIAAIPVYFLIFFFAWKYNSRRVQEQYSPNMETKTAWVLTLWAIPAAIIFALGIINWKSTHELDPYKPIASDKKPITIEVIALRWKWLFIYPEQNIATVNFIEFPENTPISFELTADDAPMNSFWIPQLGGQMYAMAGMKTHLHLMANQPGEYNGSAAEINGSGLAGMRFAAKAVSQADFDAWIKMVQKTSPPLTPSLYSELVKPTENNMPALFSSVPKGLYNQVMEKYMSPTGGIY